MIPGLAAALWLRARGAFAEQGRVHMVDFGDLTGLAPAERAMRAWLRLFHVTPRVELLAALEAGLRQNEAI